MTKIKRSSNVESTALNEGPIRKKISKVKPENSGK